MYARLPALLGHPEKIIFRLQSVHSNRKMGPFQRSSCRSSSWSCELLADPRIILRQNSRARAFLRATATSHEPGWREKIISAAAWLTPCPRYFLRIKNSAILLRAVRPEWVLSLTRQNPVII